MHLLDSSIEFDFDITELAELVSSGKAVVYTGAGTSMPADLPSWHKFLEICLNKASERSQRAEDKATYTNGLEKAEELMRQEDYLTSAGILQQVIGNSLEGYIWETFGTASVPTEIHRAIARIPFSLAITSNYDRLLESAYASRPNVWTWRDPQALFSSIKHGRFAVVKIHGDVGNGPSLVLTKNQYRDLMHLNKSFNECLTSLLSLKSFVFVGTSLKDHDLTRLMDMAILTYGADFGPHYAICFSDEIDAAMANLLRESYNIHCIICNDPGNQEDYKTKAVTSILTFLSGKVSASQSSIAIPLSKLEQPVFNLREASVELSQKAMELTAASKCRIAFVKEPRLPALRLLAESAEDQFDSLKEYDNPFDEPSLKLSARGYLGSKFLRFTDDQDSAYTPDVDKYLDEQPEYLGRHDQITGYSDSKSVLSVPVFSDGERVGILSAESRSKDAYTKDHLKGLQTCADAAGAMYLEFRHRQRSVDAVKPYLKAPEEFENTMNLSRQIKNLRLKFLLYEIDYAAGRLIARHSNNVKKSQPGEFSFPFDEPNCLASSVFRSKTPEYVKTMEASALSQKGVAHFDVSPPVFATPVRVSGSVSTVLVCWSDELDDNFVGDKDRIASLASLIVNSPESPTGMPSGRRAQKYVGRINQLLEKVDGGNNWTKTQLASKEFLEQVLDVAMESLLDSSCGLKRVRYWARDWNKSHQEKKAVFKLMKSIDTAEGGTLRRDFYANKQIYTNESDEYCRYTINRAKSGNHECAQYQHASMFGIADQNCTSLEKDPNGSWLVAPIVREGEVLSFFSADNHSNGSDVFVPDAEFELQRYALDIAVRLVEKIIAIQCRKQFRQTVLK